MNFDILIILTLITLGYLSGTWVEKRHYKSIRNREDKDPSFIFKKSRQDYGI